MKTTLKTTFTNKKPQNYNNSDVSSNQVLTYLLVFVDFPRERTFMNHSLSGQVQIL